MVCYFISEDKARELEPRQESKFVDKAAESVTREIPQPKPKPKADAAVDAAVDANAQGRTVGRRCAIHRQPGTKTRGPCSYYLT